jgi:hypothetical protein
VSTHTQKQTVTNQMESLLDEIESFSNPISFLSTLKVSTATIVNFGNSLLLPLICIYFIYINNNILYLYALALCFAI